MNTRQIIALGIVFLSIYAQSLFASSLPDCTKSFSKADQSLNAGDLFSVNFTVSENSGKPEGLAKQNYHYFKFILDAGLEFVHESEREKTAITGGMDDTYGINIENFKINHEAIVKTSNNNSAIDAFTISNIQIMISPTAAHNTAYTLKVYHNTGSASTDPANLIATLTITAIVPTFSSVNVQSYCQGENPNLTFNYVPDLSIPTTNFFLVKKKGNAFTQIPRSRA